MSPNETIARTFADQFTPPLSIVRTDRVDGVSFPDAWLIAHHDKARSIGVMAHVYSGQIHAYIQASGRIDVAITAGKAMAHVMGMVVANG